MFKLVLLTLSFITIQAQLYRCPSGLPRTSYLKTYKDKCYYFEKTQRSWDSALGHCHEHGGTLVNILDHGTQQWIERSLEQLGWYRNGIWIGLRDYVEKNIWRWTSGNKVGPYDNWDKEKDQPNCSVFGCFETCGQIRRDYGGKWHDVRCSLEPYSYVCMYNMKPLTTTRKPTTTTKSTTTKATTITPTTTTTTTPTTTTTTPTTTEITTRKPTVETTEKRPLEIIKNDRKIKRITQESTSTEGTVFSAFGQHNRQEAAAVEQNSNSVSRDMTIGIVLGCLGTLIIVIALIVAMILVKRKRKNGNSYGNPVYADTPVVVFRRDTSETNMLENVVNERLEGEVNGSTPETDTNLRSDYLHVKHVELVNENFNNDTKGGEYATCNEYQIDDNTGEKIYEEIDETMLKVCLPSTTDGTLTIPNTEEQAGSNVYVDMGDLAVHNQTYNG